MYKKLFTVFCALAALTLSLGEVWGKEPAKKTQGKSSLRQTAVVAQSIEKAVQQAARNNPKKLLASPSTGAREDIIPLEITVVASFDKRPEETNLSPLTKECPAVRISSHFLLASMACVGLTEYGTLYKYAGGGVGYDSYQEKVSRWIRDIKIYDEVIPGKDVISSLDAKLILIYINPENTKLAKKIQPKPTVNLFVPKNPQSLIDTFSKKQISREHLCLPGRVCANVEISQVCSEKGCFKLEFKFIKGDSGDPIFGLSPELTTEEFLLGFNQTDVKVDKRQSGNQYHFFTKGSIDFIKQAVQGKGWPQDWNQIQKKMGDETYFDKYLL